METQKEKRNAVNAVDAGTAVETPGRSPRTRLRRPPRPPERLQASPERVAKLKAERVQELLKALPGWRLGSRGRAIRRRREFDTPQAAASFATFVAGLAGEAGQAVNLHVAGGRVDVTLPGRAAGATYDELTLEILGLAQQIG